MSGELDRFRRQQNQFAAFGQGLMDMSAGPTRASGQFLLDGMGEAEVHVPFPVKFAEKPLFSYAAEIRDGDMLIATKMPVVTMVVTRWLLEDRPPFSNLYTGAIIGVVADGPTGSRLFAIWHMDGTAYANPV